jgi:hypothetical protein
MYTSRAPPKPQMVEHPLENRAPQALTREEIMSVLPPLPPYRSAKVVRVSTDLAVKYGTGVQMGEAENMRLAAGVPSLLVPCTRCVASRARRRIHSDSRHDEMYIHIDGLDSRRLSRPHLAIPGPDWARGHGEVYLRHDHSAAQHDSRQAWPRWWRQVGGGGGSGSPIKALAPSTHVATWKSGSILV